MTLTEIAKYRLLNQQITETKLKSVVEMVQWFGAIQGQEYAQTKWGIGIRLPHINDSDIETNFTEGKIIRTHLLRPTWHIVSALDLRWLLMLTAPRVNAANAYMYRQLELDNKIFNSTNDIIIKTLQGGKQLTRDEINVYFNKNKIIATGHRLSYIMMYAELAGIICSGARNGNQFTYALLEERIPLTRLVEKDEALSELTKRYFFSRGPATIKDFSTWSGLTLTDCKKGIEMTISHFEKIIIEKESYYYSTTNSINKKPSQSIHLLPIYDEYIMGYKDRSAYFESKNNLKLKPSIHFDCMIVSDGQIIGTWKRLTKSKSITVEYNFFKPLTKSQKIEFKNTIDRLEEFTNTPVDYLNKK